jgi:hypothetical protein
MQCDLCRKPMLDDATIWRVSVGYSQLPAVQSWCEACAAARTEKLCAIQRWHPEQPCEHCGRSIIFDARRRMPLHTICNDACRYAIRLAQTRARRARNRQQVSCAMCGNPFLPKRADAMTCSRACRQRAYRQRQHIEVA